MRRLSIQFTCLLALLPALALGCAKSEAPTDYAGDARHAEAKDATAPGGRGYDYAMDMADGASGYGAEDAAAVGGSVAPSAPPADGFVAEAEEAPMAAPDAAPAGGSSGKVARREGGKAKGGRAKKGGGDSESKPAKIVRDDDSGFDKNLQSGTLTAGSFDDNLNPWVFDKFVDQVRSHPELSAVASAFAGERSVLRVQDERGRPLANATVTIDGKTMKTRSDGRVVYVQGWDSGRQGQGKATIAHSGVTKTVKIADQIEQMVTLKGAQSTMPDQLDIALVIDATGSMGDELEFLKVEIRDISEAIARHFPNVDQRFALIVYRDQGDQYVTRTFDFTGDLDQFQRDLADQSANGGGDYPEALDAGMEAAAQLSWRGGSTARVTFLVADAPPHTNDVDDALKAVDSLRAQGVAVYPVASSGVAGEAEFVMRASAMLTGGQYLFLTDDSGVGNPHAEPHIPCYTVEQLAPLMVRSVRSELAGKRIEAEPQYSIRTVGKGQGGVCEKPRKTAKIAR